MKTTLSWLNDFVDVAGVDAADIALRLTLAGVEVDSVESVGDISEKVVVAKINKKAKHPNADTLSLCQVTDGSEDYDIVCGAGNMKEGDCVALAKIGAVLPGNFKIKKSKIRGEVSFGMLCASKELGLAEDAAGIMILPANSKLGQPVKNALALADSKFDIEITPNRGDLLSVVGLARELAALGVGKEKIQKQRQALAKKSSGGGKSQVKLDVRASDQCPRYMLQEMTIESMPASPQWIVQRLEAAGLRSINAVVDITNYVLLEWGQPLHAFDIDKLVSPAITVRLAKKGGESITCLDEQEYNLTEADLAICDDKGPVCIAGVMGGIDSGVTESSKRILLEAACFDASFVRRTAKKLGLSSDSSFRFERGVDPDVTHIALARAAELIEQIANGKKVGKAQEVTQLNKKHPLVPKPIKLRCQRFSKLIGVALNAKKLAGYLQALGCTVQKSDAETAVILPPTWRYDLKREIDLIEETVRLHGLQQLPLTLPRQEPDNEIHVASLDDVQLRLQGYLQARGFYETKSLTFVSEQQLKRFGFNNAVKLQNPLGDDFSYMRPTLAIHLLDCLHANINSRLNEQNLAFCEFNRVYQPAVAADSLPSETALVSGVAWSQQPGDSQTAFLWIKEIVEKLVHFFGVRIKIANNNSDPRPFLHPNVQGEIFLLNGKSLGYCGEVHPGFMDGHDGGALFFELNLDLLNASRQKFKVGKVYKPFSRLPAVKRDLAMVMDKDQPVGELLETIYKIDRKLTKVVEVVDVYTGEQIPQGKKSVAFRVFYQSDSATLEDSQIEPLFEKAISTLAKQYDAQLRA